MIKRLILLVLFLGLILPVFADQMTDQVDKLFAKWDKKDSPGCALAIIKDGKIIYKRGYGMADLERDVPITSKSIFDIASTSKQFVAMSIVLLAEEGKISLDDDIRKHIPEMPDYGNKITIRHLVHHTSGIRDYCDLMGMAGMAFENDYPEAQIIELIARQKALNFKPGDKHLYSNSGYFLLGEIVKRVSGKSLNEFTKEKIFQPLGMKITHFYDDFTRVVKNRAIGYFPKKDGYGIAVYLFDLVGDGGLLTSVEDLFSWDQNFYHNKLGKQGQKLIEQILTPGTLNNGKKLTYAFGLGIREYKGLKMVSHGGSWAGYRAQMLRFPGQQFSVICLSNLAGFNPTVMASKVADIYLSDHLKETPKDKPASAKPKIVKLPESELKDKTGAYRHPEIGAIWHIIYEEKKLKVKSALGAPFFTLVPLSPLKFQAVDEPVDVRLTFLKPGKSGAKAMNLEVKVEDREPVVWKSITLAAPSLAQLKEYAGNYYSEELDATYKLFIKEDKLYFQFKYSTDSFYLEPAVKDEFQFMSAKLQFKRDNQGKISGFTIDSRRSQNIGFKKK